MTQAHVSRRRMIMGALGSCLAVSAPGTARAEPPLFSTEEAFDAAWSHLALPVAATNEAGFLTWNTSYALQALLRMYQATLDIDYLSAFVPFGDAILAATDASRGVLDGLGRSGPVWRMGAPYTAAVGSITNQSAQPIIQIRFSGSNPLSAQFSLQPQGPSTFSLSLLRAGASAIVLNNLSLDPLSSKYVVRAVSGIYTGAHRWTAQDLRTTPAAAAAPPAATVALSQTFHNFPVATGMISYPLAKFARIVSQHSLTQYSTQGAAYKAAARAAADFHDPEWSYHSLPTGLTGGDYVFMKGAPHAFDGVVMPYNQTHALGQTLAELYRIDGAVNDRKRVNSMVYSVRSDGSTGGLPFEWPYWPTHSATYQGFTSASDVSEFTPSYGATQKYEDISHGAITVEMFAAAHRAGLAASTPDINRLCATYLQKVKADATHIHARVDGSGAQTDSLAWQVGRWIALEEWASQSIAAHADAVWSAAELSPQYASHVLNIAYRVWAANAGWLND